MASQPVLEIRDVHKSFGAVAAVRGVSLAVGRGEFVALLGPNGAGKTTLVEMIEGIQRPDRGDVTLFGSLTWARDERAIRSRIGLSLQETRFMERVTTEETLRLFGSFYGEGGRRIDEILDMIRLGEKRDAWVQNLSGGQRQRLALGVALLGRPELLLLDEPTTGLDPNARRDIWTILEELRASSTTVILTTHYMEEAELLCERIVLMDQGAILAQGTLPDLLAARDLAESIEFRVDGRSTGNSADLSTDLGRLDGVQAVERDDRRGRTKLRVRSIARTLPLLLDLLAARGDTVAEIECRRMTLDDLFAASTGRRLDD